MNIVEINALTKQYKKFMALNHMTFTLQENKIYGLLGRNGARYEQKIISTI